MQQQVVDEAERIRRQEFVRDTRAGLALGMSYDEFVALSKASEAEWRTWLRAEMKRSGADDPVECLPAILVRVEQRAVQAAREVAKIAAEEVSRRMLTRAIT